MADETPPNPPRRPMSPEEAEAVVQSVATELVRIIARQVAREHHEAAVKARMRGGE
ncbi:hypothetical protein [Rhodospirillum centenum]|uniref:Uncharacterized protein n=1 Tax=Rhodospirillum centenum (strain ATCC 51521 / SW) TaxID=414684 RepID=B6IMP1_RHOCS|nr:hypothetical protein [Rhodospirillum centenum]ACI98707.1 hypothetical protein RC1_1301 [Rhodospirillum centenum SW]